MRTVSPTAYKKLRFSSAVPVEGDRVFLHVSPTGVLGRVVSIHDDPYVPTVTIELDDGDLWELVPRGNVRVVRESRENTMRLTEGQLRRVIRRALREGFEDIRTIEVRMRIKVAKPTDPTVPDVLTDVRGVRNVITVTQLGPMAPAPEGKNWIELEVGFVDDDDYDLPDLIRDIRAIRGVDMVRIRELDPEVNVVSP